MQDLLHIFKRRLANLGQNNRALRLSRLSIRKDIDWTHFSFLDNVSAEDLFRRLLAGKEVRLISKLDARFEPVNLMDQRLNQVYRTVTALEEETGAYDLFVGYPFVEGKFAGGEAVRCPVVLFPVRLERQLSGRPRWRLVPDPGQPVSFNPTFFLAYEQFQKIRLQPEFWDEELPPQADWAAWLTHLYQRIEAFEVEVNFNADLYTQKLESVREYPKSVFDEFKTGALKFRSQAVLGLFPQSDSALLQDYESLLTGSEWQEVARRLWPATNPMPPADAYVREEDRFFVTPVDQSQEDALLRIKRGESLVLFGPPGTGKSQVIVNIIADAIAHGKRVLLVSQKRAALDVVYQRLNELDLGRFAMLVHDHRADRQKMYARLARLIEDLPQLKQAVSDLRFTKWKHDYGVLSRELDQLHREYQSLYDALNDRSICGLSAHELYQLQDIGQPLLPVQEAASRMKADQMEAFLDSLDQAVAYAGFFYPEYPWRYRLALHTLNAEGRSKLLASIGQIPGEIAELRTAWEGLDPGWRQLASGYEPSGLWLGEFRRIESSVAEPDLRQNIHALQVGRLAPQAARKALAALGKILDKLKARTLLSDFPWSLYETGEAHLTVLAKARRPAWWRLSWLRAHWFWKKWLEPKGISLSPVVLKALQKEVQPMRAWHKAFMDHFERPFFSDFPVFEDLPTQEAWLFAKRRAVGASEQLTPFSSAAPVPFLHAGGFDAQAWARLEKGAAALARFRSRWTGLRAAWAQHLHPVQISHLDAAVCAPAESATYPDRLRDALNADLAHLQALDRVLASLSPPDTQAIEQLAPLVAQYPDVRRLRGAVQNSFFHAWLERIEALFPVLQAPSAKGWPQKQVRYEEKIQKRIELSALLVRHRVRESIVELVQYNRLGNAVTYRDLLHQTTKKRLVWPVRKLVQHFWGRGLDRLAPCWLASPESVAAIFPMASGFFDIVVFDEASQCYVERALPVMLRGAQVVIAGDNRQLQPLDLYRQRVEEADDTEELPDQEDLETESILDLARIRLPEARLEWHYRSASLPLIAFSNHHFYDGRLAMAPPAFIPPTDDPPIVWVDAAGKWEQRCNPIEGSRVVELALQLLMRPDRPSVGIVTFNFPQQELIRDLLDRCAEDLRLADPEAGARLQAALYASVEGGREGLFIKNIENVQGDERDIIVFSIGYGPDQRGKMSARFGLLNQQGGANRLNVAITRARRQVYVVASVSPDELPVEGVTHEGPRLLKAYLKYAQAVSERRQAAFAFDHPSQPNVSSAMSDWLKTCAENAGLPTQTSLGLDAYRLDLAIADPQRPDRWALGIECEGYYYFKGRTPKEREVYRPAMLRARNWKLVRVWARNFWLDKKAVWREVLGLVKEEGKDKTGNTTG